MLRVKAYVFWLGLLFFVASGAGAAPGLSSPSQARRGRASQVARGREVYASNCVRCHGADGQGRTRMAEMVEPPDMSDPEWQRARGDARMVASVTNGRGQMPGFKRKLSRQDIAASVAYVRTLRR